MPDIDKFTETFQIKHFTNDIFLAVANENNFDLNKLILLFHLIIEKGYKNIIIDFTKIEYISKRTLVFLSDEKDILKNLGCQFKIVVNKTNPRTSYSLGSSISNFDVCLSQYDALKSF